MNFAFKRQINGDQISDAMLADVIYNLLPSFISNSPPYLQFPYDEPTCFKFKFPISSVCHRWRDVVSNSAKLWERVTLLIPSDNPPESDFYPILYRMAPAIKHLTVKGAADNVSTRVFLNFPTFPNVKTLQFNVGPNLTPMEWALVVELFPNVERFACFHNQTYQHLNDRTLQLFATGWKNLVEIDISACHKLTGAGLIDFVTIANRLQSIDIAGIPNVTDRDVDVITNLLSKSLKSISIAKEGDNISGLAVQSIVQNCPSLEEISIWKPLVHTGHLQHLNSLRSLTIEFSMGPANCEGLEEIFCRPFAHLRELVISNVTNVTDSILMQIANSCPMVKELSLSTDVDDDHINRLVTDSGLDQIVDKCRHLTKLDLAGFPLLTGRSFGGSRAKLPNLTYLSLSDCEEVDLDSVFGEFMDVEEVKIYLNGKM